MDERKKADQDNFIHIINLLNILNGLSEKAKLNLEN